MDLKEIKEVIRLMKVNDITDFELEKEGFKIVLKKETHTEQKTIIQQAPPAYYPHPQTPMEMPHNYQSPVQTMSAPKPDVPVAEDKNIEYILSPMVGTYYAAPSPDSPPYVSVGQEVKLDDIVCIVEAMKVFNEIKAETSGKIIEIMVENGAPVEYGQKMFKIKKN